jgi:hypothetical protein
VDESATGSVNSFFGSVVAASRHPLAGKASLVPNPHAVVAAPYNHAVHLRPPSVDRGVQSFLWSLLFFLVLYFGMVAVAVSKGTALVLSLVASFLIFVFIRTQGRSGSA